VEGMARRRKRGRRRGRRSADCESRSRSPEPVDVADAAMTEHQPVNFIVGDADGEGDNAHHLEAADTFPGPDESAANAGTASGVASNRNSFSNMADLVERRRRLR